MRRYVLAAAIAVMPLRTASGSGFVWPSRVQQLRQQLVSADLTQRRTTMREIQDNYSALMAPLVGVALGDTDRDVRILAARVTLQQQLTTAALLKEWLVQNDPELRSLAAEALGRMPDDTVESTLARACDDEEVSVRRTATQALGHYSNQLSTLALVRATSDPDGQVRKNAIRSLLKRDEARIEGPLTLRVNDVDPEVRATALRAAGVQLKFDQNGRAPILVRAGLDDVDSNVRLAAAEATAEFIAVGQNLEDARSALKLVADGQPLHGVRAALDAVSSLRSAVIARELYARWAFSSDLRLKFAIANWVGKASYFADELPSICLTDAPIEARKDCLSLYGPASRNASVLMRHVETDLLPEEAVLAALADIRDASALNWICGHLDSPRAAVAAAARAALTPLVATS
ncbi:MAG TPA: HEAT repeat domain-containing protein, partial [Polyangiaceae bacterium]